MVNRTDLYYQKGFKYQLKQDFHAKTKIIPTEDIKANFIQLDRNGLIVILKGYAWDGPSGPTYDSDNTMAGSLVHDAVYQLIRAGRLPASYKGIADETMKEIMVEDGMWKFRAKYFFVGVNTFGDGSLVKPRKTYQIPAGTKSKRN